MNIHIGKLEVNNISGGGSLNVGKTVLTGNKISVKTLPETEDPPLPPAPPLPPSPRIGGERVFSPKTESISNGTQKGR